MANELQILKKIWENEGKTSVKLISDQTGLGLDYVRYLCNCLIKGGKIKPVRKKPGWYIITAKGKKKLKLLEIFKPQILKEDKGIKKVILPWPKELLKMRLASFLKASTFFAKPSTTFQKNSSGKRNTQKVVLGKGRKRGKKRNKRKNPPKAKAFRQAGKKI